MHIAHKTEDGREQTVLEHLQGTASRCAGFADGLPWQSMAREIALWHDVGKYSAAFQRRIRGENIRAEHSLAGALETHGRYPVAGLMMAYCIAGHHTGLPDYGTGNTPGTLAHRLGNKAEPYDAYREEVEPLLPGGPFSFGIQPVDAAHPMVSCSFLIRMLYSCLADADFLDTEGFMRGERPERTVSIAELKPTFDKHMEALSAHARESVINAKREQILRSCREKAKLPPGFFTLTVPTGGGKTLSSMAFALDHALQNGQKRIIYAIPYMNIIEQNAAVFGKALGKEHVLEHHSSFQFEKNDQPEDRGTVADYADMMQKSAENWDMPVIVTTNVRFFESIYANKSSAARRLHNMMRSVIILDETQMLPANYLQPCLHALCELVKNYACTVVLCTATQPAIRLPGNIRATEIADDPGGLYRQFRRVNIVKAGKMEDEALAARICREKQALAIVNTRRHARELYARVREAEGACHLSTLMCPQHRREILDRIKESLAGGRPCRAVSTQLVEAGVDIDFPVLYRSVAGLDSIAQAAGRCNREGRIAGGGRVFVFEPAGKGANPSRGWLHNTVSVGAEMLQRFDDPLDPEAIRAYFEKIYATADTDEKGVLRDLSDENMRFAFAKAAGKFALIEDNTRSVVIPYNQEAKKALRELSEPYANLRLIRRRLQQYTVNVYENEYAALYGSGVLSDERAGVVALQDMSCYDRETGLRLPAGGEALCV